MTIELNIDEDVIKDEMSKTMTASVKSEFSSYEISSAIREKVAEAVLTGALKDAIGNAIDLMDLDKLTQSLASEMSKAMTAATVTLLREQTAELVYRVRGGTDYATDKKAEIARITAQIAQ